MKVDPLGNAPSQFVNKTNMLTFTSQVPFNKQK